MLKNNPNPYRIEAENEVEFLSPQFLAVWAEELASIEATEQVTRELGAETMRSGQDRDAWTARRAEIVKRVLRDPASLYERAKRWQIELRTVGFERMAGERRERERREREAYTCPVCREFHGAEVQLVVRRVGAPPLAGYELTSCLACFHVATRLWVDQAATPQRIAAVRAALPASTSGRSKLS